jgi:outer membrane protein OmpA-like peptidoglycan-associated protein
MQRRHHQRWVAVMTRGSGSTMMRKASLRGAAAGLALLFASGTAWPAQVTEQQIIVGLQGPPVAVAIDPQALIAEVNANVGKGVANQPAWSQLSKLTQFVVDIEFEFNSTAIVPSSYVTLGAMADALHHPLLAGYKFLVIGHTDSKGAADYNLKLSLARAQAIREALTTTFAVAPNRLVAIGVGEELPLDAANPEGAVNRRVQLVNIGEVR